MKNTKTSYLLKSPSVLLVIGAGFVMASSKDIRAALGMGAAVLISMLLSAIVVSAVHKIIPDYAKMPVHLMVITGFVSIVSMFMEAWFPEVVDMLGIHLSALAVSAVIYRDCEEVADRKDSNTTIKTAIVTGVFFTVVMVASALIREVFGNASIWGTPIEFLEPYKISALAGAFGGYIILAIVVAVIQKITGVHHEAEDNQ